MLYAMKKKRHIHIWKAILVNLPMVVPFLVSGVDLQGPHTARTAHQVTKSWIWPVPKTDRYDLVYMTENVYDLPLGFMVARYQFPSPTYVVDARLATVESKVNALALANEILGQWRTSVSGGRLPEH